MKGTLYKSCKQNQNILTPRLLALQYHFGPAQNILGMKAQLAEI